MSDELQSNPRPAVADQFESLSLVSMVDMIQFNYKQQENFGYVK